MRKLWIDTTYNFPMTVLLALSFVYVYVYLISNNEIYMDVLITQTNLISFSIHFILLSIFVRRSFVIKEILNNIVLRIGNEKFITKCLICIMVEITVFMTCIYIIPLSIFMDRFINITLYIMYVLMWLFIFLVMEVLILISMFFHNKVLNILFIIVPFLINVLIQLNVMSLIYS